MSTHVIGFRPPDEEYARMRGVYNACAVAGVSTPDEVLNFFDGAEPDERGTEIEIPYSEWSSDSREGVEVDVRDLPMNCKIIRFYNSY